MKSPDQPRSAGRTWRAGITALFVAGSCAGALGQAFTPGNLVVVQAGDGIQTIGLTNGIFLDQFTPSGTLVSQLAIPTNGPSALLQEGNQNVEGFVNLSPNGQELVLAGYNVSYGFTGNFGTTATSLTAPRAVATVDVNGNYSLVTNTTVFFSTFNVRSAATDGNFNFWAIGNGGNQVNGIENGLVYMGTNAQAPINPGTVFNDRDVQYIGGNLYYSTGSDKRGIIKISGAPTTGPLTTTNYLIPTGTHFSTVSSPTAFAFNPDMTVCYVADLNTYTNSQGIGGVEKWTNSGTGTPFSFAYTLQPGPAGNTNGAMGITVSFGATTNIYGTFNNSATNLFEITDVGPASVGSVIYTAPHGNVVLRGICFAPTNGTTPVAPVIASVNPASQTVNIGSTVAFTAIANVGTPAASNLWYQVAAGATNLIAGATGTTLTLTNAQATNSGNYFVVLTNASGSVTSAVVALSVVAKPTISSIAPTSVTTNAGQTVTFTLTSTAGTPPASNFWYAISGTLPHMTNLIASATGTTLTLSNVIGANAGGYFAILTNASGSATSAVATLTVLNDPNIQAQPANTYGLLDGTVYFSVGAFGTTPSYQWYFTDGNGNLLGAVNNGYSTTSGLALVSGANTATLAISNLQTADLFTLTNLAVVVTNVYGAVTSSVASLLAVNTNSSALAFWDFNGPEFTNTLLNPNCISDPAPFLGVGTAMAVGTCVDPGTSPFSGAVDGNDGMGFASFPNYAYAEGQPEHLPPFSWGTDNYPATGGNKQNGVQFNVSTVGAKNIWVYYESRVSATASDYERVQYTTNGTDWVDYPSSSTFGGVGTTYLSYSNNFTGFPGVANNPDFGIRIVTEYQSTATYGIGTTNGYVGTANTYGTAGTVTYDVVTFYGDAITNNNTPPVVGGLVDTNTVDYLPVTNNFTVSDATTPPDLLNYSAVSLDPTVSASFTFTGSGLNRSLIISPDRIAQSVAAAPILVTVTDPSGDSTVQWFTLTLTSSNLPPTNSLTSLQVTNLLANATLTIPFTVGDDHTTNTMLTDFTVGSDNNTLIPAANIVVTPNGANPILTITPATNQLGVALISVTLNDDDVLEPKTTTAYIAVTVRPNTNVVSIDYFDYDNNPPNALDTVSAGFWQHLSGNFGQMKVGINSLAPDTVTVDAIQNTENLQTPLVGAPYRTNSGGVLYASYVINFTDPTLLPRGNGTYLTALNDGSGLTGLVEGMLVVATNNAANGDYQLGIIDSTNEAAGGSVNATNAVMFPQDLVPGTNYTVVTALVLSNGFSTLWINPSSPSSPSVSDHFPAVPLNNISDFELRESGQPNGGTASIGQLKVGTTFDSVLPALHIRTVGNAEVINWSDPTLSIQTTTNLLSPFVDVSGATSPFTNSLGTNGASFFRFGQ